MTDDEINRHESEAAAIVAFLDWAEEQWGAHLVRFNHEIGTWDAIPRSRYELVANFKYGEGLTAEQIKVRYAQHFPPKTPPEPLPPSEPAPEPDE